MKRASLAVIAVVLASSGASAQTAVRRPTTVAALHQFPSYFQLQNVLVHGEIVESGSRFVLRGGESEIRLILNDVKSPSGLVEVRGQLIDVGRLEPGDARLRAYGDAPPPDQWPRPGEELVLNVTGIGEAQLATSPSVRALALQPWRFEGQKVTIVGEFRGRNLFGDLPNAPAKSRFDFVLRSADAAVWVTDLRPRGRGFDLSVEARVDTGRWLQVSGTVALERGLVMLAGTTVAQTAAPQDPALEEEPAAPVLAPEEGEVIFSSPTDGDTDVPLSGPLRIQFSRGLDPASLTDRIRVSYVGGTQPGLAPLEISSAYDGATRGVEIRFARPPDPFRTLRIEVLEGVRTFDGAPVRPWSITFTVAGN